MVWIYKTKIWWKCKALLYGCRELHCPFKTDDVYKDIVENVETRFDTSNYDLDRPLTKEKNKKAIGLMKGELGGK